MKTKSLLRAYLRGIAGMTVALAMSGCGGGLDFYVATPFDINVVVGGQVASGVHISPGPIQTVYLPVGQSIAFDASEPVTWTLLVGGSNITGTGVTINYGGVYITPITQTRSRVYIETASDYLLGAPLSFTLIATSTYDFAQVATIRVVLTN